MESRERNIQMGPLKSMEEQYPFLDFIFLHFCASRGVFTVEDFLIHDLNDLLESAQKQSSSQRLKQGIDKLISIVDGLQRPWLNGVELLTDAQQNKQTLSLIYEGIDSFLHGALREGFVTEVVGPSSSGKTQVCLRAAASVAKGYAGGVVFLDTGNSFSAPRIARLINQTIYSTSAQENHEALHKIMKNIWCYPVFDIFSLLDVLHLLESKLKSQTQTGERTMRLLIVDSFSSLIIPVLGGGGPYGDESQSGWGRWFFKAGSRRMLEKHPTCAAPPLS